MNEVETQLNKKIEGQFLEAKKGMVALLDQIAADAMPAHQEKTSLTSANTLFKVYGSALERVGIELPRYCNQTIDGFQEEIKDAPEPEKSNAVKRFTALLTAELSSVLEEIKRNTPNLDI